MKTVDQSQAGTTQSKSRALPVTVCCCLTSVAWIALTDLTVAYWFPTSRNQTLAEAIKDSGFVLLTGFLLYYFIKRLERLWQREARQRLGMAESLDRQRLQLAGIIDSAVDGMITIDKDQKIVIFNSSAEQMFRCPRCEAIGRSIDLFIPESRRAKHSEEVRKFAREGTTARTMGHFGRVVGLRFDGQEFPLEASISRLQQNDATYLTVTCRDISERIATEQARKNLEEQLRQSQKLEAIGQLAGGVAHDFNNLLTVINGNASLLIGLGRLDAEQSGLAQQVVEAAERAASLTRQLLMFSRKQPLRPVDLDLNEVARKMTGMLQRILGEDISLRTSYQAGLPRVHGDTSMLEQTILNLSVNARDAMPTGGAITIATTRHCFTAGDLTTHPDSSPGEFVCLSVADTGTGIPPENLPHIFEPFFTTKDVNKGTGLGLAMVYGVVKQHHGWIEVQSTAATGTTFRIFLPAVPSPGEFTRESTQICDLPVGREIVLVVEDEPALRILVHRVLARCGYTVLLADSGREAITLWKQNRDRIELLLTDIIMPDGMTGWQLAGRLLGEKPELKVIYTSGYSAETAGHKPGAMDSHLFLPKPYAPRELAQLVRTALDSRTDSEVRATGPDNKKSARIKGAL